LCRVEIALKHLAQGGSSMFAVGFPL